MPPVGGGLYNWGSLLGLELTVFHLDRVDREAHGELQGEVCDDSEKSVQDWSIKATAGGGTPSWVAP